ncbi:MULTISPECIES: NepR family anti-sigma factor [Bartonella]|uniref:Anti-sigma factor NepR domain-containing protein n=3 Tax=Bartonella schoenbuchensis TaxID=165694 RepID=E6Z187_BARSR|nr:MULTISPECIES: NepR family anti-sigma factor [Bartonella]ENN90576.1 hypothetical protein m07a_11850 [Bartonella schoenbuchensis m07a]CBI82875.1 conserved hypothetical protein [Bartonella schoenbuchensis R1]CDP80592.1 hypothetical protein BN1046_01541 [Bartonella schoenbuchensis]
MNDCGEKNLTDPSALGDNLFGVNSEIVLKLRQFYMGIQEEAIPVRFLELLERLDQAERASLNSAEEV